MWRMVWFFLGSLRLRLTGASPQWSLNALAARRVGFRDLRRVDDFSVELTILTRDLPRARAAAQRAMCQLEVVGSYGFAARFGGLKHRIPFLVGLLAVVLLVAAVLPRFVLFYRVEGNDTVPLAQILRELEDLGVGFGTYGPSIKPQWLKNHMLTRIPKLQWLTVTQNGCCATVIVRERPESPTVLDRKTPRNVIAARGGLVTRVDVMDGNGLCKPGDVVEEGQMLVSAYRDLQFKTQVSSALAEVYARTWRRKTAVLPDSQLVKTPTGEEKRAVSVIFGQKRVNIFGNSGISTPSCDKMTTSYTLTLPGEYQFPLTLEVTSLRPYTLRQEPVDPDQAKTALEQRLLDQVQRDMIAGQVLAAEFTLDQTPGKLQVTGLMECEEMIARMVDAGLIVTESDANEG